MFKVLLLYFVIHVTSGKLFEKSKDIGGLIVGGQPVKIEDIPYQAAIYYRDFYFCCGCIITPDHIVSAAHCLWYFSREPRGLTIRVGSDHVKSGGQVIKLKRIILHPKFSLKTVDYDVSVAVLASPLKFAEWIKPIKLAEREPSDGQQVKVSGWGYLKEKGPASRILQSVIVQVVNRDACERAYKNRIKVTKRMLCASMEGKDACYGDSGGPLVSKEGLVGIVSMGEGCARKSFPGIYTSVGNPEIKDFIIQQTNYSCF